MDFLDHCRRNAELLDVLSALIVHAIYRKYEVDPSYFVSTFSMLLVPPMISTYFLSTGSRSIMSAALVAFPIFYASLAASIVWYRVSPYHPLARYPGPFLAKISKFHAMYIMSTGQNHVYHKRLHEKYGPYVRVGPNELSVVDEQHIVDILGAPGLPKGPMWDGRTKPDGVKSLIVIRDQKEHIRRRKPWNRAFSMAAMKDYEPALQKRASQLMRELEKRAATGDTINLRDWMMSFTFDFMGDMIFGGGFNAMQNGIESEPIIHIIEKGLKVIGLLHHVPWLARLFYMSVGKQSPITALRKRAVQKVNERRASGSQVKDVYYYLIDEEGIEKERPTEGEVISDGLTAIIAGYDTTASVLTALFYYVLRDPKIYSQLQAEIDAFLQDVGEFQLNSSKLTNLPYLNAVINEALRLGCPVDVMQRSTTEDTGGRLFGENYIPPDTSISVPLYTLLRSSKCFSPAPNEFHPERFLGKDKVAKGTMNGESQNATTNLAAFIPFSFGPEICAGRPLAMNELRLITVLMMRHFEMRFVDGYNPDDWPKQLRDWFVMSIGPVPVQLKLRTPLLD